MFIYIILSRYPAPTGSCYDLYLKCQSTTPTKLPPAIAMFL